MELTDVQIAQMNVIYRDYSSKKFLYELVEATGHHSLVNYTKEYVNSAVEECKKALPKSLIDKLDIKKIE